ncbi:hypothetical protein D9M70_627610 [compost metagenome]
MISGAIAPQFSGTNWPWRPLSRCSSRATTSLPVPDSPVTSTVDGIGATRATSAMTFCMASDAPMKSLWMVYLSSSRRSR